MKILIFMTGFFPGQKFGGPPVSVNNFCSLMAEHECYIVTRNHDLGEKNVYSNIHEGWNDRDNCKVIYLSDEEYKKRAYKSFEKVIKELSPNLIYLQGLFQDCVLPCLALAKKYHISVLLAPRGELCSGAFKKKYKKIPYIAFARISGLLKGISYQSTSEEETEAIKKYLGVKAERIWYLTNIPSIPRKDYHYTKKEVGAARFIYLSRIVPKKNLAYALEMLKNVKGQIEFDIYGSNEDASYWDECKLSISSLPGTIIVTYKGNITHDEVQPTFANYDALLFPTKSENFGHAIVEALSVGCPAVISDQTPWIDLEEYSAGWAIPLNKKDKYEEAIQRIVDNDEIEQEKMRNGAKYYFSMKMEINIMHQKYKEALEGSIKY